MPEQEVDAAEQQQSEDTQQDAGFFSAAIDAINDQQESELETTGEQDHLQQEEQVDEQPSEDIEQSQDSPEAEEPADVDMQEEGVTGQEETEDDTEVPDKENPDRFQYWQSKAQKFEQQYGDLDEDTVDLAKNIRQNPDILKAVEQAINGGGQQEPTQSPSAQQQQEQEPQELTRPERPTKPSGYNRMDAASDPDSESYKYEQELMEYQENLADYLEQKDRLKEQQRKKQQQTRKQQQAIKEQKKQIADELQQGYGYTAEQSQDFLQYLENQPNNLDSYRKLYEAEKGIGDYARPKQPKQKKPSSQKTKSKSKSNPLPAGVGGGATVESNKEGGFFG